MKENLLNRAKLVVLFAQSITSSKTPSACERVVSSAQLSLLLSDQNGWTALFSLFSSLISYTHQSSFLKIILKKSIIVTDSVSSPVRKVLVSKATEKSGNDHGEKFHDFERKLVLLLRNKVKIKFSSN